MSPPPPLPAKRPTPWFVTLLIVGSCCVALMLAALVGLRMGGLLKNYRIPTAGMAPAFSRGDHMVAEGLSLLWRNPRRGEVVVFDASTVPGLRSGVHADGDWIKRVVALPGDRCQIKDGSVWINGSAAPELSGHKYVLIASAAGFNGLDLSKEVTVPPDQYIVLGDNTQNSLDGRYWGFLPRSSIKLLYLCHYWRNADRSIATERH